MKNYIRNFLLFILAFFCINISVSADSANGYGFAAPGNSGGTGACFTLYGGCWPGPSNIAFRLTLVDLDGKKIKGTRSVDFSSSSFFDCDKNGNHCPFGDNHYSPINESYENGSYVARIGYKYSEQYSDQDNAYDDVTNGKLVMYHDSHGYFTNQYTVEAFLKNNFRKLEGNTENFNDLIWSYDVLDPNSGEIIFTYSNLSFYDMFLHYCGFLGDGIRGYALLSESDKNILRNSTIIFEPAYPVYFSSGGQTLYRYGTVTELANYMIAHPGRGLDWGVSSALRTSVGLCVSEKDKNDHLKGMGIDNKIFSIGVNDCKNNISLQDIVDSRKTIGLAVGVLDINEPCLKEKCNPEDVPPSDNEEPFYNLGYCTDDNSTIDFSSSTGLPSAKQLHSDTFKINDNVDDNQNIWCFDSVQYHFDNTLSDLGKTHNKFTFVNPSSATANVSRVCLYGENYSLNQQYNIDSYKESALRIGFYGNVYDIYPSDSSSNTTFDIGEPAKITLFKDPLRLGRGIVKHDATSVRPREFKNENVDIKLQSISDVEIDGNNYKYVQYSFGLDYVIPNNLLFIGDGSSSDDVCVLKGGSPEKACISLANLDNALGYGKSAFYLSNEYMGQSVINTYKFDARCSVSYDIADTRSNINFRVISLQNPFPARDGTSRLPAENWLSTTQNNVYNYITNNRGVMMQSVKTENGVVRNTDPELMYDVREPMYTITLTPSTMLKIRGYNKKYSYYSMYELGEYNSKVELSEKDKDADKLKCNSEGRECYSEFLRDNKYIPQDEGQNAISGVCFFGRGTKNEELIRNQFNEIRGPRGDERKLQKDEVINYINALYGTSVSDLEHSCELEFDDENKKITVDDVLRCISGKSDASYTNIDQLYALSYGADVNYNGRLDSEDIEIMISYAKSKAPQLYYTCAHKTFKSGGPVKEDE